MPSNAQNHLDLPLPCMSITKARDLFQDMPTPDANMPIESQVTVHYTQPSSRFPVLFASINSTDRAHFCSSQLNRRKLTRKRSPHSAPFTINTIINFNGQLSASSTSINKVKSRCAVVYVSCCSIPTEPRAPLLQLPSRQSHFRIP